jgi:hypothetical protein
MVQQTDVQISSLHSKARPEGKDLFRSGLNGSCIYLRKTSDAVLRVRKRSEPIK